MSDPEYIKRFAKAVYPDSTELCLSIATEESMLTDAVDMIDRLREDEARLDWIQRHAPMIMTVCTELTGFKGWFIVNPEIGYDGEYVDDGTPLFETIREAIDHAAKGEW